jgi:hypothetical protein
LHWDAGSTALVFACLDTVQFQTAQSTDKQGNLGGEARAGNGSSSSSLPYGCVPVQAPGAQVFDAEQETDEGCLIAPAASNET